MGRAIKSSVVIAQLLKSEGFSDHVGNIVEKYWLKSICSHNGRKVHRKLDKGIAEMCVKLSHAERLVLGRFIAIHKKMSFDTGLRIGLTAFATKLDKEYDLYEQRSEETGLKQESTLPPGEEATPNENAPRRTTTEKRRLAGLALAQFDNLSTFLGKPAKELIEYTSLIQMVKDKRDLMQKTKHLHAKLARQSDHEQASQGVVDPGAPRSGDEL